MNEEELLERQKDLCERYQAEFVASPNEMKLGISRNIQEGILPINGLRHLPNGDTTGWYIYAGEELSEEEDFFVPLHVAHIKQWCPKVQEFLGLAPGWRFLISDDYEDVWFDTELLVE